MNTGDADRRGDDLSTCNRSEIYAISEEPGAAEILSDFYVRQAPELADYLYWKTGDEAVRHLFRAGVGLRFDDPRRGPDSRTDEAGAGSVRIGGRVRKISEQDRPGSRDLREKDKGEVFGIGIARSLSATAVKADCGWCRTMRTRGC